MSGAGDAGRLRNRSLTSVPLWKASKTSSARSDADCPSRGSNSCKTTGVHRLLACFRDQEHRFGDWHVLHRCGLPGSVPPAAEAGVKVSDGSWCCVEAVERQRDARYFMRATVSRMSPGWHKATVNA